MTDWQIMIKNDKWSFVRYDIREFYPSIMEIGHSWGIKTG